MKTYDVIVLGAGAAGLFAASIAGQRGRSVLVLEKANKIGKKILMSGGGRCNFTNLYVEPENFISNNPHFCKSSLSRYTQWDFIDLVTRYAIPYEERKHGQLFCLNSAKDILNMLAQECEMGGVEIKTHTEVNGVKQVKDETGARFQVDVVVGDRKTRFGAESVIVASGALSIPTLGGSGVGYDIASRFNLNLLDRRAGLVPFTFSDQIKPLCERLSGLALEVTISCAGQSFTENLLFTHRGMSGPSVLQISNYWLPGDAIHIDLLPSVGAEELLRQLKNEQSKSLLRNALIGHLAKPLIKELENLWWPEFAQRPLAEMSDAVLAGIAKNLNNWIVKPSGTEGYRTAEVTLGGVDTDGVSSKTMEAKDCPGLFFVGEVLDVTGHLGGFNFQWAWSSGYTAGMNV